MKNVDLSDFSRVSKVLSREKVFVEYDHPINIVGPGISEVGSRCGKAMLLTEVFFAPNIIHNLISIRKLSECKHEVQFNSTKVHVTNSNDLVLGGLTNKNSLFFGSICVYQYYVEF